MKSMLMYIYIDESGNLGELGQATTSRDFCMAAIVCSDKDLDLLNQNIKKIIFRIKKKELKFSKLNTRETVLVENLFREMNIMCVTSYGVKTNSSYGEGLLRLVFKNLIEKLSVHSYHKVKVFIDGAENAYFRKIYEPIIRQKFRQSTLRFANSVKTPMIQVADFYAGDERRKRNN